MEHLIDQVLRLQQYAKEMNILPNFWDEYSRADLLDRNEDFLFEQIDALTSTRSGLYDNYC